MCIMSFPFFPTPYLSIFHHPKSVLKRRVALDFYFLDFRYNWSHWFPTLQLPLLLFCSNMPHLHELGRVERGVSGD
nr:hypothetical protein Iba_chr13aCG7930 [Ipomoea batatas]GMD78084.1 hypothetical protein Iba_chr13cCG9560 [Ipomoea batatas]